MRELYLDIETFSTPDIRNVTVYPYAEDPRFDIQMCAFAYDDDPVEVLIGDEVLQLMDDIRNERRVKVAHGAIFERVCFSVYGGMPIGRYLHPRSWVDTQALAAEYGYPQSLKELAKALGVSEKDSAGTALTNFFCKPNRKGERNLPEDHPEKWAAFVEYCRQDVITMREARKAMPRDFPTKAERDIWETDQLINDRGIRIDQEMARNAEKAALMNKDRHIRELIEITSLANPNSPKQLLPWLQGQGLRSMKNLQKETVAAKLDGLKNAETDKAKTVRRVLELRQEIALTASSKYSAALNGVSRDGRLRGQFRFFKAHTGRWSGRGMQLQNLPRLQLAGEEIEAAGLKGDAALALYELRLQQAMEKLELGPYATPAELKALVRPLLLLDGVVVDYAAIEARCIAWESGEEWALDAFRAGRDIYVETAQRMGGLTRSQGKVAVLALGYNGGVNSLRAMGYGGDMTDDEVWPMVRAWRAANPNIVRFWRELGEAFNRGGEAGNITVEVEGDTRYVRLPSGRAIVYHGVIVDETFKVFDEEKKRWVKKTATRYADPRWAGARTHTYGGRLSENVTQAVARDLLAHGLVQLEKEGYRAVGHVHDEVLVEGATDWKAVSQILCDAPDWAAGLPMAGDGFFTTRYRKG